MNFADIIELKPENINGNYLHFIRVKTKRTKKKDLRPIRVGLNPKAIDIIKRQKNTVPANPYLFPVLEKDLTPLTTKHRCQRFIQQYSNARVFQLNLLKNHWGIVHLLQLKII